MASELSELRAELWRTRDDLERMKSRTPPKVARSPSRFFDRRNHEDGAKPGRDRDPPWCDGVKGVRIDRAGGGGGGGGVRSGPTSPPTSGESSGSGTNNNRPVLDGAGRVFSPGTEEAAAEETLCNLELEEAAFKNWTEEASSIAVRLIEEVKTLRWEKASWEDREAASERTAAELREQTEALEKRLHAAETEGRRSQEALLRAQQGEREQARASERANAELRVARDKAAVLGAQVTGGGVGGWGAREAGLREELKREKEGADALQRRLDNARAAAARHERERKEWRTSRVRLEELRRVWGKQLRKIEKKMRSMTKSSAALQARLAEAERARDRADADAFHHRDELRRLTEQRDNLLLGATRAGHLSATSPSDALAELLAAAAAGVAAGAGDGGAPTRGSVTPARGLGGSLGLGEDGAWDDRFQGGGGGSRTAELEAELDRARAETKLARVAVQQERLRREGAARDKEEAVRQLHRLMGAARRAVGRRDSRLKSSRLETEVVWNALTQAVR